MSQPSSNPDRTFITPTPPAPVAPAAPVVGSVIFSGSGQAAPPVTSADANLFVLQQQIDSQAKIIEELRADREKLVAEINALKAGAAPIDLYKSVLQKTSKGF